MTDSGLSNQSRNFYMYYNCILMSFLLRHPPLTDLDALLGDVFELNQRAQPHLERYRRLAEADAAYDQSEEGTVC